MLDSKRRELRLALALLALAVGVGWASYGLLQLNDVDVGAGSRSLGAFLAIGCGLAALAHWLRCSALGLAVVAGAVLCLLAGDAGAMLTCAVIGLSSLLLGWRIFPTSRGTIAVPLLVGAGLFGTIVGCAAHFPVAYPGVYALLLGLPLWGGRKYLPEVQQRCKNVLPLVSTSPGVCLADAALGALGLMYLAVALMPEAGHDALAMHLFIPAQVASRHMWGFDTQTYVWAVMPMQGDWLFTLAYLLAGEPASRVLNAFSLFLLARVVWEFAIWANATLFGARLGAVLLLSTPLAFTETSSLFIEPIWAAFVVGGTMAVFSAVWGAWDREGRACLRMGGLLMGFALASKAVTLPLVPVIGFGLLFAGRRCLALDFLKGCIPAVAMMLIVGGVPYVTAWSMTGNPVFPFFNELFRSPFYPPVNFDSSGIFGKGLRWDTLYQATFHSERFIEGRVGAAGFQWLVFLLPTVLMAFLTRNLRMVAVLSCAVLGVAVSFQSVSYLRYVFPSFAFFAASVGVLVSMDSRLARRFFVCAISTVCVLNVFFLRAGTYYGSFSIKPLLGSVERGDYLDERLPIRNSVAVINGLNLTRSPVAIFATPLVAGLEADALHPNWYNYRFSGQVSAIRTSEEMGAMLIDAGVIYVLLDEAWGTPQQREMILAASESVFSSHGVSVRRLREDSLYKQELLERPDFTGMGGWAGSNASRGDNGEGVTVSVTEPLTQAVEVVPGKRYRSEVTITCNHPVQARNQVNWLNRASALVRVDIRVVDCQGETITQSMDLVAPEGAMAAMVYASGHGAEPVRFLRVSFRK